MKNAKPAIKNLLREYRKRIEDFKKNYQDEVKLTINDIDNYVNTYKEQLEVISNLESNDFKELFEYVYRELINFREPKIYFSADLNFSKFTLTSLKRKFIKKPPIQIDFHEIQALADSIYVKNPWDQELPQNDLELKAHIKWWEIEKWKNEACEKLLHSSTGGRDQLSIANNWLPNLIKEINKLKDPTHEKILALIKTEFPDFEGLPHDPNMKYIKGLDSINKTKISKTVAYLFNQRHKEKKIQHEAIIKRANNLNWW